MCAGRRDAFGKRADSSGPASSTGGKWLSSRPASPSSPIKPKVTIIIKYARRNCSIRPRPSTFASFKRCEGARDAVTALVLPPPKGPKNACTSHVVWFAPVACRTFQDSREHKRDDGCPNKFRARIDGDDARLADGTSSRRFYTYLCVGLQKR